MPAKAQMSRLIGNVWAGQSNNTPILLAVMDVQRPATGLSGRIVHDFWVLDYSFTASWKYRAGGPRRPWKERSATVGHLYPPRFPYWEDTRPIGQKVHSAYVTFTNGEAAGLNRLLQKRVGFLRFLDPHNVLGRKLQTMAAAAQKSDRSGWWLGQSELLAIVHLLRSSIPTDEETRRICGDEDVVAKENGMTAKVSAYLQDNLSRSVSLAEIAEHLHVSVSSLTHRYREEVGETPMETRMRLAVTAAKTLLLKGWPLKHIAERTGFCDEYHLSKTFKKLEKTSPRAWLQSFSGIPFREKYF